MSTLLLIRHGRSTANTAGVLAGWSPHVHLDEVGVEQAKVLGDRLSDIRLTQLVSSPLERTQETAAGIVAGQKRKVKIATDDRLGECRYGDWTGQPISSLLKEPLWKVVQSHPSSVRFPGKDGEAMVEMQSRAVAAVHEWNRRLGTRAVYAMISHGDVIKAVLADALGMHLDHFQRLQVDPCSLSVIRYTEHRPFVLRMNDSGADLSFIRPPRKTKGTGDAVVGGGAGHPVKHKSKGRTARAKAADKVNS